MITASSRRRAERAAMISRRRAGKWRAGSRIARWCASGRDSLRCRALRQKFNEAQAEIISCNTCAGRDGGVDLKCVQPQSSDLAAPGADLQEGTRQGSDRQYAVGHRVHEARSAVELARMHRKGAQRGFL